MYDWIGRKSLITTVPAYDSVMHTAGP